jgi:hypothetical protein
VAEHANGFLYNSRFTAREFVMRHKAAAGRPNLAMLLSTRVEEYPPARDQAAAPEHILILGNHFPHKASDEAGRRLAAAFPDLRIVVLGANDEKIGNLQVIRPGTISADCMRDLYAAASVVVLPSHLEGFGLGLMHGLAAGKPIAARSIPATREILACLAGVQGVELFDRDPAIVSAVRKALAAGRSQVSGSSGPGWRDWADGMGEMCVQLARSDDVFDRLVKRLYASDLLRQSREYRSSEGMAALIQERSQLRRRMHVPLLGYAKLASADSTQDPDGWLGGHLYVELLLYRPVVAVVLCGWRHEDEATRLLVRLQCGDACVDEQCGGGAFALELRLPVPKRDRMELRINSQTLKAAAPDQRQISFILEHIELIHEGR